ncbi:MAG: hypothetical protein FJ098_13965 [Deltaproteobacteria bacterium]|nr:hypothetical protein [Deltaproteobacteria bacterium]
MASLLPSNRLRELLRDRARLRERLVWTLVLGPRRGAPSPGPRPGRVRPPEAPR